MTHHPVGVRGAPAWAGVVGSCRRQAIDDGGCEVLHMPVKNSSGSAIVGVRAGGSPGGGGDRGAQEGGATPVAQLRWRCRQRAIVASVSMVRIAKVAHRPIRRSGWT